MEVFRQAAINGYNDTLGAIRAAQLKHIDMQDRFYDKMATC